MEFYTERKVTVRKPHVCFYCGKPIEPGQKARYESGKYEGELFYRYACEECMPHTGDFWDFCDGETWDAINEFEEFLVARQIKHSAVASCTCPSCGPIVVRQVDYDDDCVECPKCGVALEMTYGEAADA